MKKFIFVVLPVLLSANLNIQNSYKRALEFESKVNSYMFQVEAKKEEINLAKSKLKPKVNLNASAALREYKINATGDSRDEKYALVSLGLDVPVFHPEYDNFVEQSKMKHRFSMLYLEQLKQDLAYNVVDAYISILRADNSLKVAKSYLSANKIRYEQIKRLYEKKLSNKMDLLASKVTYEQSKIKVNSEKQNLRLAKFKFKNLTGIDSFTIPNIDFEKVDVSSLFITKSKDELFSQNLEIKKSKLNIDLTKKQIKNSQYGYYPKVDLSASATAYGSKNEYTDYTRDSRVMLNMKIPLYQGGYVKADISKYRYLLSAANEDLKDVERKVEYNYEELYTKFKTSKRNITLYKDAIESARLYLHATKKGFEVGLKNVIDLEDAKAKLYESQFKLIDSVYEFIKSYVSLLNLYGDIDSIKLSELDSILTQ